MACSYYGQDEMTLAFAIASALSDSIEDLTYLNYLSNLILLVGQQMTTIASAKQYYCTNRTNDTQIINPK